MRFSATVFIADRRQPVTLDGAVYCDITESSREVGGRHWRHSYYWFGNHSCNVQTGTFILFSTLLRKVKKRQLQHREIYDTNRLKTRHYEELLGTYLVQ